MLCAHGLLAAIAVLVVSGCAASTVAPQGTEAACAVAASHAIRTHESLTSVPAACHGLSRNQVNAAASLAITIAAGSGAKSVWRRRAGVAAGYVSALITAPGPPTSALAGGTSGGPAAVAAGSRLGFSERAAQVGALLAWLAAAASGGWVLVRWWRAGGTFARLRRRANTTAPPAVIIGHVGLALLGLVLWSMFMITGQVAIAWVSVGLLALVAGLGMGVLVLGLPSPRPFGVAPARVPARAPARVPVPASARSRGRQPVFVIAAHGLFAAVALLMVALAAIGGG